MHAKEKALIWTQPPFDLETRQKVETLLEQNPEEIEERFYEDLAFGTGGMRGLMGIGTNRLNIYTIRKATKGLAQYLLTQFPNKKPSVVIGFDNRRHSEEFAKEAMETLTASGIDVFLFKELRPTPLISFACKHLQANGAIMITASHNPKEYNGYKVYWQDGAQVVPPHDRGIIKEVNNIKDFSLPDAPLKGECVLLEEEIDQAYLKAIQPLAMNPKEPIHIVYTSLHGTGITIIPKALVSWGFSLITLVDEQVVIDPDFPTVTAPNPEYKEALSLGTAKLISACGDILLASDPDADRLAVTVMHKGNPVALNGNETAAICLDFLAKNTHYKRPALITSIVSTRLLEAICKAHDIACVWVLTGFKYIGEKIHLWEQEENAPNFLFGAEESYGYLYGTHSRDKDAIVMSCLIATIASSLKKEGKTLVDALEDLYQTYGVFKEGLISLDFAPTKAGEEQRDKVMLALRNAPPKKILDISVENMIDYTFPEKTHLPKSDVLSFTLEDKTTVIIRPSGTEPKIKLYIGVQEKTKNLAEKKLSLFLQAVKDLCNKI